MVEATQEDALPIVLLVAASRARQSADMLVDKLALKEGDALDRATLTWQIVTNYYKARVRLEILEVPSDPEASDAEDLLSSLEERNIQAVVYCLKDVSVS